MKESTKELIGITPASILSMLGLGMVYGVYLLINKHLINMVIGNLLFIPGIIISSIAIYKNWHNRSEDTGTSNFPFFY